jgi:peptidoglycan-N-acetylglucosamine deacetylase
MLSLHGMHRYFIKTPWWVKRYFHSYTWHIPVKEKEVFLTFDDGPHPRITPWVLDVLKQYNAEATFFCVGNNVVQHPEVYKQLLQAGHAVGNHTHTHLNGWKTNDAVYLNDVQQAALHIDSVLFRPPYGRIRKAQAKKLKTVLPSTNATVIMWDVLSADFDAAFSPQKCLENVLKNTIAGSVIVFHDSEKAEKNLKYALPKVLETLQRDGYRFSKINAAALKKLGPG